MNEPWSQPSPYANGLVRSKNGRLITHRLPLDEVLEGIELVARGDAIKVTIEP